MQHCHLSGFWSSKCWIGTPLMAPNDLLVRLTYYHARYILQNLLLTAVPNDRLFGISTISRNLKFIPIYCYCNCDIWIQINNLKIHPTHRFKSTNREDLYSKSLWDFCMRILVFASPFKSWRRVATEAHPSNRTRLTVFRSF